MKTVWIVSAILFFMSVASGLSQAPVLSTVPLDAEALATILAQSSGGTACLQPEESGPLPDQPPGIQFMTCSATATCNDTSGVDVSCDFGGSGGACTFQDQNCAASIRGQVNCNGTVTQCPACPCSGSLACCQCAATGSCFWCCKCGGGRPGECSEQCAGG